jgi:hypothetical protein
VFQGDGASVQTWVLGRKSIAIAIALVALAASAGTARAASTRAEYVAQVDPICQSAVTQEAAAAQPLTAAVRRMKKHQ